MLCCVIFDYLYNTKNIFDCYDVVSLFNQKQWLSLINKKIVQKKVFDSMEDEMREAVRILELQDLKRAGNALREFSDI